MWFVHKDTLDVKLNSAFWEIESIKCGPGTKEVKKDYIIRKICFCIHMVSSRCGKNPKRQTCFCFFYFCPGHKVCIFVCSQDDLDKGALWWWVKSSSQWVTKDESTTFGPDPDSGYVFLTNINKWFLFRFGLNLSYCLFMTRGRLD